MSDGMDRGLEQRDKEYLGDGVYAGHDGFQIWLTAENGIATTEAIALEPAVFSALVKYEKHLREKFSG